MELASLAPVIAGRVGKQIPLCIESGTRNWTLDGIESLETLFVVLIPKVYHPVCSHRGVAGAAPVGAACRSTTRQAGAW